jgi:hypothetical protein
MKRIVLPLLVAAATLVGASAVQAQYPYVSYYQPTVSYYAPVSSPTIQFSGTAAHAYYPGTFPSVNYYPTTSVVRYRPFLGNRVVRYPYSYSAPVTYYSY